MEFIESFCPSAASAAEKLYQGLHDQAKKIEKWTEKFIEDMPDSIRVPFGKVSSYILNIKNLTGLSPTRINSSPKPGHKITKKDTKWLKKAQKDTRKKDSKGHIFMPYPKPL